MTLQVSVKTSMTAGLWVSLVKIVGSKDEGNSRDDIFVFPMMVICYS